MQAILKYQTEVYLLFIGTPKVKSMYNQCTNITCLSNQLNNTHISTFYYGSFVWSSTKHGHFKTRTTQTKVYLVDIILYQFSIPITNNIERVLSDDGAHRTWWFWLQRQHAPLAIMEDLTAAIAIISHQYAAVTLHTTQAWVFELTRCITALAMRLL